MFFAGYLTEKGGRAVKKLLAERKLAKDFVGCYVPVDGDEKLYGISRGVLEKRRQHVFGKTHFDASLAYRTAFKRHPPIAP
jgi:hypothetical protein